MTILLKLLTVGLLAVIGYFAYTLKSEWIVIAGALGLFAGLFWMQSFLILMNRKIKSYKREVERKDISDCENSSRVEVLESKIEVLEKALKNALENKND